MLKKGTLRLLAPVFGAFALCSCASFYRLEVGGAQAEQVRSLFLLVADQDPLGGGKVQPADLISPDRVGKYLYFAQYDPIEGNPLRWREEVVNTQFAGSDLIKVTLSTDQRTLTLRVNKDLLEDNTGLTVVALGHFAGGWTTESVSASELRREQGIRLDTGSARFARRPLQ